MDLAAEVNLARQMVQMGRVSEAVAACRRALGIDPGNPDAAYLLGIVLLQQGDAAGAAPWMLAAARAWPNNAEVHANLGHTLRAVGRLDDAAAALEHAIALRPDYAQALNNLGMVRRAQGELADAEATYRRALAIIPNLVPANFNLGNVLKEMGRHEEAATVFRRVVSLLPSNPDGHCGLGDALFGTRDFTAAKQSYEAALRIDPAHAAALTNLGLLFKHIGKPDDSIEYLRRGERAKPNSADIQEKLGRGLWDAGMYEEGLSHFERAVAIRPSPAARVAAATLVPPVYTSLEEVTRWRERLVSEVRKLRAEGVKVDLTNYIARSPFYIPYAGLDDRDILREIALLHQPPADPAPSTRSAANDDGRTRVGFVSSFFKDHTVGLWMQGLIATLPRERFQVTVISTQRHEDDVARFIRSQAQAYVELPATLPPARELVAGLGLDVLIYADLGMEGLTYSLAFNRLAPVQCAMWGHPSTSGISTVDYFISSALAEAPEGQANYTEKLVALKNLPLYYYRPPPAPPRLREDFSLSSADHVYGCLHSTFKLHPQYDAVLAGILRADPAGVVLLPRTGSSNWDRMVLDRIRGEFPDVVDRIRFIDRVPRDEFAALNRLCDVTLAPFPFGAGDTSLIALAAGVPVVTLETNHLRGNFTAAMYRAMGWTDLVAQTPERYIEIATRLAKDPERRREVEQSILAKNSVLFENPAGVNELADFLVNVSTK